FMGATIIGGALLQWPIGRFSDHHDRRAVLTIVCFGGVLSALTALYVAELSLPALLVSAFIYGGFAFSVYSLSVSHVNDQLTAAEVLQATSGLLLIYGIGATVGPALVGIFMDILGPASLLGYLATVHVLLGLFGLYRTRVGAPAPAATHAPFVPVVRTSQVALELDPRVEGGSDSST
ncbi:MAG: MFS transporter, partial [Burkholderiales bacterium]|nr:MFS transporter [Burkholderiales bacterium]